MSDGEGNGATPTTLAQQVSQLRTEVGEFRDRLEADRHQLGRLNERWGENLDAANEAARAARAAEKAAADTRQYCMTRFDQLETLLREAMKVNAA